MKSEKILWVGDFRVEEVAGGGERYDSVLINELGCDFIKSFFFSDCSGYDKIVISNFAQLSEESKQKIMDHGNYMIIEHDFKIFQSRVPNTYPNFTAPPEELINVEFFQRVKRVVLQSQLQTDIFARNLKLDNVFTLHGNIWSREELDEFEGHQGRQNGRAMILSSAYPTKGVREATEIAKQLKIPFDILPQMDYNNLIKKFGEYSCLISWPMIVESFGRTAAEAKMSSLLVITNDMMACVAEEHYQMSRFDLINYMHEKREELVKLILDF